jgi:hypothetical protein
MKQCFDHLRERKIRCWRAGSVSSVHQGAAGRRCAGGDAHGADAARCSPGHKLGPVTMSGSFRSRLESWDWFQGDADNAYAYSGSLLRLSFSQKVSTVVDWQLELALPLLLGLPDGAVAPGAQGQLGLGANYFLANDRSRNAAGLFIKQSFVRFKRSRGNAAHSLRLGRMEFVDGTEVVPKNSTLAAVNATAWRIA